VRVVKGAAAGLGRFIVWTKTAVAHGDATACPEKIAAPHREELAATDVHRYIACNQQTQILRSCHAA